MTTGGSTNPNIVVDIAGTSATSFFAYDSADQRYFLRARIDTYSDYLIFRIRTRILGTTQRSSIPPEDFFDAMMAHFQGQPGGLPEAIHAIWEGKDSEYVTNLERFNAALLSGDDEVTAAGATFTGRMAFRYNYSVVVLGVTYPPNGPPWNKVHVYFKKTIKPNVSRCADS